MCKSLLIGVSLPLLVCTSPAFGVDIDGDNTDPIDSQTIDNGSPGDIVILSSGNVLIGSGQTAVTLNSDNTITNNGQIGSTDADNSTGILVSGDVTGAVVNSGTVSLTEDFTGEDTDDDGDLDTPFAIGTGRTGILLAEGSTLTGGIQNASTGNISIEGNESAGIQIAGTLNGDLFSDGTITVTGDNSNGIAVTGTLNGDLTNTGTMDIHGENSNGIYVDGDINGTIINSGIVSATGFRSNVRGDADTRDLLDENDLLNGGAALAVGANITGGIINDIGVDENGNTSRGRLASYGSSPALLVTASLDGEDHGDIVISAVGDAADDENYGIINHGDIIAAGTNDGFSATGIRVEGATLSDGATKRMTTIEGGIFHDGTLTTDAFEANSTGIAIGANAMTPQVHVGQDGSIVTSSYGQTTGQASAIVVESGANVDQIMIDGVLRATFTGTGEGARAATIVDESGTVNLVQNSGQIIADYQQLVSSGNEAVGDDTTRRLVAIDLSANSSGVTVNQVTPVDNATTEPSIVGDVVFGNGDDTLALNDGYMQGDVLFGNGQDTLVIDNGAELTGAIHDSDGQLVLDVRNGLLALGAGTDLTLTSATFGDNARLQLSIDPGAAGSIQSASFNASGAVTFLSGARIAPILNGLIGDSGTYDLFTAGSLTHEDNFSNMLDTDALPYLYSVSLSENATGNTLIMALHRRTATELGMSTNEAAAYEPWFNAVSQSDDSDVSAAFARLISSDDFFSAYDQLLPEFAAAALQFTLANTDGTTGAIGNRIDAIRRGLGPDGGIWIQELGYYLDRTRASIAQPYNGYGLGLALGMDQPMLGMDTLGWSLSAFSNQISESNGFDSPLSSLSGQFSLYGARNIAGLNLLLNGTLGVDHFDSERKIEFGDISRTSTAGWGAWHTAGTARLSQDYNFGNWLFSPSLSLDYLRLAEEGYTETGGGVGLDLNVAERTTESLSGTAAFTVGRKFGSDKTWWAPRLRVGVRNDFKGDGAVTDAAFAGFTNRFQLTAPVLPETALLLGFSLTAHSRYTSFGFDYDADIRDGFTRHVGKVVIRFVF